LSAATASEVLSSHPEAKEQLKAANVCILTKTDQVSEAQLHTLRLNLEELFAQSHQSTPILTSSNANLPVQTVLKALHQAHDHRLCHSTSEKAEGAGHTHPEQSAHEHQHDECSTQHHHEHEHGPAHATPHNHHRAQAYFWPIADHSDHQALQSEITALKSLLGDQLLRLKGRVKDNQGAWLMQMAPFDQALSVQVDPVTSNHSSHDEALQAPKGLTLIVSLPLNAQQTQALLSKAHLQTPQP
jgi:G3E family GTPase